MVVIAPCFTKEWQFGSVHNWELQNHWSWASWQEATKNRPLGGGWWWWWWWLRWLFFWWFYDLGWPQHHFFVGDVCVFDLVSQDGFCHSEWVSNVGNPWEFPAKIQPNIDDVTDEIGDSSNGSVCPTCFPRLGTGTDRGMVRGCGCRGQETNMTWHQRFLKHTCCIILSDC